MENYQVKFTPFKDKGHLLGVASVCFMDSIVIRGVRLLDGAHGYFIAMPQQRNRKGEYIDCVYPLSKEIRDEMTEAVISAYSEARAKSQFAEQADDNELPL